MVKFVARFTPNTPYSASSPVPVYLGSVPPCCVHGYEYDLSKTHAAVDWQQVLSPLISELEYPINL